MKYLFSRKAEVSQIEQAPEGESVIPEFPCRSAGFIAIPSFKFCALAEVKKLSENEKGFFELLVDKLTKQYPGIPRDILEQYVIGTARAASQFKEGTILRIFVNSEITSVQDTVTENVFNLWNKHPKTKEQ